MVEITPRELNEFIIANTRWVIKSKNYTTSRFVKVQQNRRTKMISMQDKEAILNGAYGVTRSGKKVKYVGKRDTVDKDPAFPHFFVVFNENDEISRTLILTEDLTSFTEFKGFGVDNDVVGLWEDCVEPFNLKKALIGEPVMTRDRSKAYVQAHIAQPDGLEHYSLIGFGFNGEHNEFLHWDETGKVMNDDTTCDDIIGMWNVPEPVSKDVTVTLPRALKEPQDKMWFVDSDGPTRSSYGENIQLGDFEKIPYFGSEEDAKAWFDAMQDSRK